MAKKNFYCVKKGLTPGIYTDWESCKAQVQGFPGAVYKGFATIEEAKAYMGEQSTLQIAESEAATEALRQQLEDPELASDFEKLMEIQADIDAHEKQQEELLQQLLEAEEELEEQNF